MSVSSGGSLSSVTSFRRLSQPSSEYSSVDRQNQPLSTPPERPLLNHDNFIKAMYTVEFPDMYMEKRLCDRETAEYESYMGVIVDGGDFLTFTRRKLVQLIYIHFDLDSENLWEEFKGWCLEHNICNNAWLRKHEQFAFRKHASKGEASRTKNQEDKLRDTVNDARRKIVKLWISIWRHRDRAYIRNSLWHYYADHVKADGNRFASFIGCDDSAMRRTNDIYDPCFQWDYEIGKHGVILGMKAFLNAEGTTSRIVGWTPNPEHAGFIGHPNYFITPDVILKWWIRTIRESLDVLSAMILSAGIIFDHDFGIEKFNLEHFYDPARITLATAPHDLDHLSRLLFELQKLFSNRTEKAKLDASQAERFRDEMQKLDWCVEMLKDFRDRSELHQFFGCLEGLGSRDSFFFHPFTAYQDDCFDDEGNRFRNKLGFRSPKDFESFFAWTTVGYYAKVTNIVAISHDTTSKYVCNFHAMYSNENGRLV